ncbi:MAG: transporter substrate-binding domain-containing protein [Bifidobacterium tibiigranuli]|jgi:polar amino acid transport system substrate-binding protein|uniref:transporter substrate-binding domain-containing protein n=1 Tax=Bifidobacterium tibiigranuli TaxID=2172043 RepID=UPI00235658A0|nr:transporter substrate-binding domain-containing protein [Bifidobacterium tibiigranuli]MCH3974923.1 transporter substrate-binding domain-containing protein [Bifidobacterium tibiigranuli]MCH4190032.1 transporter substrate-binding domain-containing protein [Bifidobacterium tibiigranuli]MCH4202683.1 transporter substrate-binding domain-containing protein [Bifidobacterium tibiigranuli]MCH4273701.1 transporter substrate-binding domain-containing protein [Bifidobacterium tibiigranuli]MCI1791220.1 
MNKIRKIGAAACAVVLSAVMGLSGCGSASSSPTPSKTLKVVTYANWNPFEYLDKGKMVGFDIDLIQAVAKKAGYSVTIKNAGWEDMFSQIQGKSKDMAISGITITDDRKKTYDFSSPYFVSRQSIVVHKDSSIASAADLKGKKVGVPSGQTGQTAMEKLFGEKNPNIIASKNGLHYMQLIHGEVDAAVGDDTNNKHFIESNKQYDLRIVRDDKAFAPEYFGIMFPKGSTYRDPIDKALASFITTKEYSEMYQKWFGTAPNIKDLKS